jgi:cation:H+ antiporter
MVLLVWGKFIGLLVLIYIFGTRAAKSADVIAEKKGLSKAFMGVVFISMVTSFPELFTGISAVTIVDSPDLALGEILGSCLFNLLIIAVIDIVFRKNNFFQLEGKINTLPIAFSFILINVLTLGIALSGSGKFNAAILNVSIFSILIFVLYVFFLHIIYKERKAENSSHVKAENANLKKEIFIFVISSIIIIGVGIYLPVVGTELSNVMGWNDSFVGIIFLAFVTSFPELVVSFSTARMGAFDMLLGNITGSNLFNVAIIFFIDIFYFKSQLLVAVRPVNVTVGIIALLMNFVLFFGVVRRSKQRILNIVSINSFILILLYILNLVVIY